MSYKQYLICLTDDMHRDAVLCSLVNLLPKSDDLCQPGRMAGFFYAASAIAATSR